MIVISGITIHSMEVFFLEDYEGIVFLPPDVGVAVLVCVRSLIVTDTILYVNARNCVVMKQFDNYWAPTVDL